MINKCGTYNTNVIPNALGGEKTTIMEHLFDEANEMASKPGLLARVTLEPGASVGYHEHHGEEEVYYIIQGTAEVDDNGTITTMSAGDSILTSNEGHSIKNIGEDDLKFIAIVLKFA